MNLALWIVQGLLALLFAFAGAMKLVTPAETLAAQSGGLAVGFLQFIGVVEVLGAIGLIAPAATGIRPGLTPLAAAGLVVVMAGAVVVAAMQQGPAAAIIPLVTGALAAFVAWGRWRALPRGGASHPVLHGSR